MPRPFSPRFTTNVVGRPTGSAPTVHISRPGTTTVKKGIDDKYSYGIIIILLLTGPKRLELFLCDDPEKKRLSYMKARELDKIFDEGGDISGHIDVSMATRPGQDQKRVNVDFPVWMIQLLDKEARRLGVPRQSVIKIWIAERLEKAS